jgi:hypothetical protein
MLPLWVGLAWAVWMTIAIQRVALRAIFVTNYVGTRTARMLPHIGREIPVWQVWIFSSWLVANSALEWALIAFVVEFAIRRIS